MLFKKTTFVVLMTFISHTTFAQKNETYSVFGNLDLLKKAGVVSLIANENISVGFAQINDQQMQVLHELSHGARSCAGFEVLQDGNLQLLSVQKQLGQLESLVQKEKHYNELTYLRQLNLQLKPEIQNAVSQIQADNIKNFVTWLSGFPSRYARQSDPNQHVRQMQEKLQTLLQSSKLKTELKLIEHKIVQQKTIQVKLIGSLHPEHVIVLGAHFDSISGWMGDGKAPGADDNASGSGSLFEALRVLLSGQQPTKTIEFYWYAGEELGLLGSAEIAKQAKAENKSVLGVLNFDMAMYPGDGENNITLMTDFTTGKMNDLAKAVNEMYVKATILEDKCGYGCSDHASWFRNGFATLMATEAGFHSIFPGIHTERDVISNQMSFSHAALFSKLALAMAMEMANN